MLTFPDTPLSQTALDICRILQRAGYTAYYAGGCVRDALLEQPSDDIDIATDATPDQIQQHFANSQLVGAQFGVVVVRHHSQNFDIASFRTDGSYRDGRRPESITLTSSPQEDAQRRDFTINALFYDPVAHQLHDYVGGQQDLAQRQLRAVGQPQQRFREDHLRLLRAIRFAARFQLQIHPQSWQAIQDNAHAITQVAPERIFQELQRMWQHPERVRAFDLLDQSGLMAHIFPEFEALKGVEQPPQWHPEGDVFQHTRLVFRHLPAHSSPRLCWGALLHDIGKPDTASWDDQDQRWRFNNHARVGAHISDRVLRRLRAPNQLSENVHLLVDNHMNFINVQQMRQAKLRRMMGRPTFADELLLHRADCLGSNGLTDNYEFLLEKQHQFANEPVLPDPLLNGHDIMQALHIKPGPQLGTLIRAVHDQQLEGQLQNREQALAYLRENHQRLLQNHQNQKI